MSTKLGMQTKDRKCTAEIKTISKLQVDSGDLKVVARDFVQEICLIEAIGKKFLIPFGFDNKALRQIHSRWHDSFHKIASKVSGALKSTIKHVWIDSSESLNIARY